MMLIRIATKIWDHLTAWRSFLTLNRTLEKKNYHGSPDFITCLERKIIWTIHLHCFMTLGSSRSFSGGVTWHSSLRNRLSDWSSIAFGESSKAPKVTNWAHVFCSVWKVYSWKWTGTVHPVFFFNVWLFFNTFHTSLTIVFQLYLHFHRDSRLKDSQKFKLYLFPPAGWGNMTNE